MKKIQSFLQTFVILPGFFLFSVVLAFPVQAASFTADAVQIRGENISQAKMYWLDGDVRFEYLEDGVPMAQIFDNKNNKIIWLDLKNKYFLERDMPEAERLASDSKKKKNTDPCRQFPGAECVFLKKTKVNGREAEKWLITLNRNGEDFHIFQWIDSRYKNILRQENGDGSGMSVEIEENQTINERKVRKLTMHVYSASGEQQEGVQWYDNELDIVVRQQYQNDVVDELKNIKVGDVSNKLFVVPEGFVPYETPAGATGQEKTASNTEKQ